MALLVKKYGGSSVATPTQIRKIAQSIAKSKRAGDEIVVVVSARGDTTDDLIALAQAVHPEPTAVGREYDALLATGEKESAALFALALLAEGIPALSMTGAQAGIQTDSVHRKARICGFDPTPIRRELAHGKVVVVAGFQGIDRQGQITTLGRGGSDITASALAVGLGAERCEFFKDVPGFHTADPRVVPTALPLQILSYDEAIELGRVGAQIIHPRAVELARRHKIPLVIRYTLSEAQATWIQQEVPNMENVHAIRGVVADTHVVKISIIGVPDRPGVAARFFVPLGQARIQTDMIVQNISHAGRSDISFVVAKDEAHEALKIVQAVTASLGAGEIEFDPEIARIAVVGGGIASHPEIAGEIFATLAHLGINIEMISTSEIKISCVVRQHHAQQALQALHDRFVLGNRPNAGEVQPCG